MKNLCKILAWKPDGKRPFWKPRDMRVTQGTWMWWEYSPVSGCCEHGNEILGFKNAGKLVEQASWRWSSLSCHVNLTFQNIRPQITCRRGAAHITRTSMCERTVSSCTRSIKLAVWMDVQALVTKFAIRKRSKNRQIRKQKSFITEHRQQQKQLSPCSHILEFLTSEILLRVLLPGTIIHIHKIHKLFTYLLNMLKKETNLNIMYEHLLARNSWVRVTALVSWPTGWPIFASLTYLLLHTTYGNETPVFTTYSTLKTRKCAWAV